MFWLIMASVVMGVLLVAGLVYFFVVLKHVPAKDDLTFRHAATMAKEALLDKDHLPDIFRRMQDRTEVPFIAYKENKKKQEIPGTYIFRWPHLQITYVNKPDGEKVVLQLDGYEQRVTAFYGEGVVTGIKMGDEVLDLEDFDMRHAGTIGDHVRSFIRYHLRFPEGSLEIDKAPEPTFKPVLDLKKKGEIHLHGKPPPEVMPNFKKNREE